MRLVRFLGPAVDRDRCGPTQSGFGVLVERVLSDAIVDQTRTLGAARPYRRS